MERKDLEQKSMQSIVAEMVDYYKLEISTELRYIDLSSEVGELGLVQHQMYNKIE